MSFRISIYPLLFMIALICGCNQGRHNPQTTSNEADLKSTIQAYIDAYNQKDHEKVASFWESDAILHNPITDEVVEGREAIEKYFKDKFENHPHDKLSIVPESITFPKSDEAIIKARFQISEDGETKISGKMQGEYINEEGKWYLWNFSQFEQLHTASQFEKLETLNWLTGNWIDASENVEINSEWKWDKHKNFLTERFNMKIFDEDDFDGFQIIGWDPTKETIHAWVFDSDGGFGEGSWTQKDNSWYVSLKYTLPDGGIGSATNIYSKIDDNSYTFSSVNRDIDGVFLPDVGPFKIVRKQ